MNAASSEPVPVLWTRKQVAQAWGISLAMVDKLVATGQVASVRIGRARRIPADVVYGLAQTGQQVDASVPSEPHGAAVD